jgi:hypothetical protein
MQPAQPRGRLCDGSGDRPFIGDIRFERDRRATFRTNRLRDRPGGFAPYIHNGDRRAGPRECPTCRRTDPRSTARYERDLRL